MSAARILAAYRAIFGTLIVVAGMDTDAAPVRARPLSPHARREEDQEPRVPGPGQRARAAGPRRSPANHVHVRMPGAHLGLEGAECRIETLDQLLGSATESRSGSLARFARLIDQGRVAVTGVDPTGAQNERARGRFDDRQIHQRGKYIAVAIEHIGADARQ